MKHDASVTSTKKWRVAIIGCGRVAKMHALHLKNHPLCSLEAVIDTNLEAARSFAVRYSVPEVFGTIDEACGAIELDSAHIATPPFSHEAIARDCLRLGLHVLIEKPAALSLQAVKDLYSLAETSNLILAPDFNLLFHSRFEQLEKWRGEGKIGELRGVDLVFHYGFDTEELRRAGSPPWPFKLPGGYLHNYLSHPLYLACRLIGKVKQLETSYESRGALPHGITDSVTILARGEHATATIRLSLATELTPLTLTAYGSKGTARIEFPAFLSQLHRVSRLPSSLSRILDPVLLSMTTVGSTMRNVYGYVTGMLVPYEGLKVLIARFYESAAGLAENPIESDLAVEVARLEELIIAGGGTWQLDLAERSISSRSQADKTVLVTGGSGYLGRRVVRQLIGLGWHVRALVRFQNDRATLERIGADTVVGDVRDLASIQRAAEGVCGIIHLAAAMSGPRQHVVEASVVGAQNVIRVAQEMKLQRNIHISSFSVFDYAVVRRCGHIADDTPLESKVSERSAYSEAKIRAERAIVDANTTDPRWLIIRPSAIFGGGKSFSSLLGMRIGGVHVAFGDRSSPLRVIHVDDVADAIVHVWEAEAFVAGQAINVSHPDTVPLAAVAAVMRSSTGQRMICLGRVPGHVLGALTRVTHRLLRRGPLLGPRQVDYLFSSASALPGSIIRNGWAPSARLDVQVREDISYQNSNGGAT